MTDPRRLVSSPSFAQLLAPSATAGTTSEARSLQTVTTPAEVQRPGGYGDVTPPAELLAYGNGRIPDSALTPIGDGHSLASSAAAAFEQMRIAAAKDGVQFGVTDSYRTYDEQVALAAKKGLYQEGGLAATPGTSNHGWGLAVDLDLGPTGQDWLRRNAWRYGWVEDVPREPWHWTYRPAS